MNTIIKLTELPLPAKAAYITFINQITTWWPKSHTWSKEKLY